MAYRPADQERHRRRRHRRAARRADVAVAGGKIAEIGKISDGADQDIDADGLVVAPGFIDPHTHYDAQICWDRAITPVVVARRHLGGDGQLRRRHRAVPPEAREIAMRDLVNVEAIPFEVLNAGITWDWETFPEFMDAAAAARARRSTSRFLAPLTPFRHYVMGEASMERAATADETAKIKALARRGGRCRRLRLLDHAAQPAHRLPGAGRSPAATPAATS